MTYTGPVVRKVAAIALAAFAVAAPASGAAVHHRSCATWTRYGQLTNQTGQPIVMWDADRVVRPQVVPTDGAVPFRETFPCSVRKHEDTVYMRSITPDWQSSQIFWVVR
jgi:hypothetical protein